MPPRRRDTTTDTIPAMLAAIDRHLLSVEGGLRDSSEAPTLDCHMVYTFIDAKGGRHGIERDQLEGKVDGWPLVGKYEADYVDSNDVSALGEPWYAVQFDPEALKELAKSGGHGGSGNGSMGELVDQLMGTARIENRNLAARALAAETRADKARAEFDRLVDQVGKLQREKNDATMSRDKAIADKELSDEKRKEAEQALEFLEAQLASMKPQVAMAVDHFIGRGMEAMGVESLALQTSETSNGSGTPANGASANGTHVNGSTGTTPPAADADPAPPLADDPVACMEDLLAATVFDPEVARELIAQGILSWDTIRALAWLKTHRDPGPVPPWDVDPNWQAGAASDGPAAPDAPAPGDA